MLKKFLSHLRSNGWTVQMNETPGPALPELIKSRYPNLPESWLDFTAAIKSLVSGDEQAWFLCAADYGPQADGAFRWDELERLSLEAADDDPEWRREIIRFWDGHLPILLSVRDGYSYYAVSIRDGLVVHGSEPEFEACEIAAASFDAFLESVLNGEIVL